MAHRSWTVQVAGSTHTIELEHGYWSGKRRITVDGALVHESQRLADSGSNHPIPIGYETVIVRIMSNGFTFRYDLVVGGRSLATGEPVALNAPTAAPWLRSVGADGSGQPLTSEGLSRELRNTGGILVVLGLINLTTQDTWSLIWGVVLAAVGLASWLFRRPVMLLAIGALLVLTGLINLLPGGSYFWLAMGVFQVGLGIAQYPRYQRFKAAQAQDEPSS